MKISFQWEPDSSLIPTSTVGIKKLVKEKLLGYVPQEGHDYRYSSPNGYTIHFSVIGKPCSRISGDEEVIVITLFLHTKFEDWKEGRPEQKLAIITMTEEYGWSWA